MSEENVERFLELVDAFNSGDWERYLSCYAAEARFEPQQAALQGAYVGRDGIRSWRRDMREHYSGSWRVEATDVRDLGERVLALGTLSFTARASGITMDVPIAALATYRDGLVVHFKDYGDRDQALEAAGLSG